MQKLISVIVPVYNEQENIPLIHQALTTQFSKLRDELDYEIIFVNDGSKDASSQKIEELAEADGKIKFLEFSKNFGKEIAMSAGLHHASGDAAIIIDADLQHPPELISEFVLRWSAGAEMVVGIRQNNKSESIIKKVGSKIFYKIMDLIGDTHIVSNATDFRLIDRRLIDEFNKLTERNRITRGLLNWLGFKKDYIYFEANERKAGKAGYGSLKLFKLAMSTFVSHSLFPLKVAGYLGILITFFSGIFGIFMIINRFFFNNSLGFSGTADLAVLNIFLIGIVLSCLGLIALYVGNIKDEVANRPMYVIRKSKVSKDRVYKNANFTRIRK